MFGFEKLDVWQKAIEYADRVYDVSQQFPSDERFGLTSQVRRAAVSISSNVADGSGRTSRRDFGRFVEIAYGSTMETVSQTHIALRRQFLQQRDFYDLYNRADELARMLSGLQTSLIKTR